MKIKINILIAKFFIISNSFCQQIGDGRALEITDFSAPLKSGVYQGLLPIGMNPDNQVYGWQHLFVIRHSNDINNYQLQLSSSYAENDRLFFRKIATGTLQSLNPAWIELATRGTNSFIGNQSIIGNVGIGTSNPLAKFQVDGGNILVRNYANIDNESSIMIAHSINISGYDTYGTSIRTITQSAGYNTYGMQFFTQESYQTNQTEKVRILGNGNVGIGTTNPTSKLTVAGNINSREVKVTVDAGADFVFDNKYNLPSLESVDKFIKENKHLPEIASAKEMQKEGINLSEMNIKLLQKIEEMTLYMIEQNKKIASQSKEIETLKDLVIRVSKIEKELARK